MQHALHASAAWQTRRWRMCKRVAGADRAAGGQLHVVQHALAVPVEHVPGREGALRDARRVDVAPPAGCMHAEAHFPTRESWCRCSQQPVLQRFTPEHVHHEEPA